MTFIVLAGDRDRAADRVATREELVLHVRADDGDERGAILLALREEPAGIDVEIADLRDVRGRALDVDAVILWLPYRTEVFDCVLAPTLMQRLQRSSIASMSAISTCLRLSASGTPRGS